jgi:hypothetical protein
MLEQQARPHALGNSHRCGSCLLRPVWTATGLVELVPQNLMREQQVRPHALGNPHRRGSCLLRPVSVSAATGDGLGRAARVASSNPEPGSVGPGDWLQLRSWGGWPGLSAGGGGRAAHRLGSPGKDDPTGSERLRDTDLDQQAIFTGGRLTFDPPSNNPRTHHPWVRLPFPLSIQPLLWLYHPCQHCRRAGVSAVNTEFIRIFLALFGCQKSAKSTAEDFDHAVTAGNITAVQQGLSSQILRFIAPQELAALTDSPGGALGHPCTGRGVATGGSP